MKVLFSFVAGAGLGVLVAMLTRPLPASSSGASDVMTHRGTDDRRYEPLSRRPDRDLPASDAPPREAAPDAPGARLSPLQLFAKERRDENWAPVFERNLRDKLRRELAVLGVDGRTENLECRTSTCAFDLLVAPVDVGEVNSTMDLVWMGHTASMSGFDQTDPDTTSIHIVLHFPPEERDPAGYEAAFEERRTRVLQWRRENDAPPP